MTINSQDPPQTPTTSTTERGWSRRCLPFHPTFKRILWWLAAEGGEIEMPAIEMSKVLGIPQRSLHRYISWAARTGAIDVIHQSSTVTYGGRLPNRYVLRVDPDKWDEIVEDRMDAILPEWKRHRPTKRVWAQEPPIPDYVAPPPPPPPPDPVGMAWEAHEAELNAALISSGDTREDVVADGWLGDL